MQDSRCSLDNYMRQEPPRSCTGSKQRPAKSPKLRVRRSEYLPSGCSSEVSHLGRCRGGRIEETPSATATTVATHLRGTHLLIRNVARACTVNTKMLALCICRCRRNSFNNSRRNFWRRSNVFNHGGGFCRLVELAYVSRQAQQPQVLGRRTPRQA